MYGFDHISTASMGNTHRNYNWTPDDVVSCEVCEKEFDLLRRRHHCRKCGSIVCHACSLFKKVIPDSIYEEQPVRICDKCRWSDRWLDKDLARSVLHETLLLQQWQEQRLIEEQKRTSKVMTIICSSANLLQLVCKYLTFDDLCGFDCSITNNFLRDLLHMSYKNVGMYIEFPLIQSPSSQLTWMMKKGIKVEFGCCACTYLNIAGVDKLICEICETIFLPSVGDVVVDS